MIPGGLVVSAVAVASAGVLVVPYHLLTAVSLLASYLSARFVLAAVAYRYGLQKIRQWEATDWSREYHRQASAESMPREAVRPDTSTRQQP